MTELARTPPRLQRLFQTIDFAPLPQHGCAIRALETWRATRGSQPAPSAVDMLEHETRDFSEDSLLAEPIAGTKEFAIRRMGSRVRFVLQTSSSHTRLSKVGHRRVAARLRRLFRLVLEYGDPVDVRFIEGDRSYEVLAAPLRAANGRTSLFCTMAVDELRHGPPNDPARPVSQRH